MITFWLIFMTCRLTRTDFYFLYWRNTYEDKISMSVLGLNGWNIRWLRRQTDLLSTAASISCRVANWPARLYRAVDTAWLSPVIQEAQLSPSDRAMHLVSSNLANYHATVQKILIRQVLAKPMVWSWRFSWRQCVINKRTTVELCISPVYRRLPVAKFSKSTM